MPNREDTKYYQPSFFDTHPEFHNEEELQRIDCREDEDFPFWAEEFDECDLDRDCDFTDNAEVIDKEFLDAKSRIDSSDEEFHLF